MAIISKRPWTPKIATWPEFDKLAFADPAAPAEQRFAYLSRLSEIQARSTRGENGRGRDPRPMFSQILLSENLKAKLASFESTPIPQEFQTPEREENKKALLAVVKSLQEACQKKAPAKAFEEDINKVTKLCNAIREIPGQERPVGKEAEKYAPITLPQ